MTLSRHLECCVMHITDSTYSLFPKFEKVCFCRRCTEIFESSVCIIFLTHLKNIYILMYTSLLISLYHGQPVWRLVERIKMMSNGANNVNLAIIFQEISILVT